MHQNVVTLGGGVCACLGLWGLFMGLKGLAMAPAALALATDSTTNQLILK